MWRRWENAVSYTHLDVYKRQIYKKLADGEITLIQFSEDNNDPTKDLTELANTKVTFVE